MRYKINSSTDNILMRATGIMQTGRPSVLELLLVTVLWVSIPSWTFAQPNIWATAYYAGWKQGWVNNGHLPAEEIDYSAVTHISHFSLVPKADGTLDAEVNSIRELNSSEVLTRAHAAGKKVMISVGGWGSDAGFRGATGTSHLSLFVMNLVTFMKTRGYDGIDVDWEVLESSDADQFIRFITTLRNALDRQNPRPLLTAAAGSQPEIFARIHQHFDQINIMTYDMSGAWPGWMTWHNAPIYDGGYRFKNAGRRVPSADAMVDMFVAAGVPTKKLGIGVDFYGYVWRGGTGTSTEGATKPGQNWELPPAVQANVPYHEIMEQFDRPELRRWDTTAQAAYLSIDKSGSADDMFVSFDDETTVRKKFEYVRWKGLGGLIIWELGGGYRPELPKGKRDLLLQAVKQALHQ